MLKVKIKFTEMKLDHSIYVPLSQKNLAVKKEWMMFAMQKLDICLYNVLTKNYVSQLMIYLKDLVVSV